MDATWQHFTAIFKGKGSTRVAVLRGWGAGSSETHHTVLILTSPDLQFEKISEHYQFPSLSLSDICTHSMHLFRVEILKLKSLVLKYWHFEVSWWQGQKEGDSQGGQRRFMFSGASGLVKWVRLRSWIWSSPKSVLSPQFEDVSGAETLESVGTFLHFSSLEVHW